MSVRFTIRPLDASDYHKHYLALTGQLSSVEAISEGAFATIVRERSLQGVFTWVVEDDRRIVGTVSLFLERKFYRSGRRAGHIEDVIVDARYRRHGLGTTLVEHALCEAKKHNCYKVILDCKENLEYFYAAVGFEKCNIQMAHYI